MDVKAIVKQNEERFQAAYADNDWDTMWHCIYFTCLNLGKKKCQGIVVQDLEGKCLDATIKIMARIKEGVHPNRLSSYCYLFVIGVLWNKKHRRWEEGCVSFEEKFQNYAYEPDSYNVLKLCRSDYS